MRVVYGDWKLFRPRLHLSLEAALGCAFVAFKREALVKIAVFTDAVCVYVELERARHIH